jgi:hypothetical protein
MARADLSSMLSRLDEPARTPPTPEPDPAQPATLQAPTAPAEKKAKARAPKAQPISPVTKAAPATDPLYLRLERKETRLRADQYADLTELARRLSRAKTPGGDRITENTLIRVAIDLLLEHASDLSGETEAELKKSVTL